MNNILTISIVVYKKYDDALEAVSSIEKYTNKSLKKKIFIIDNSCYNNDFKNRVDFENKLQKYNDVEYFNTGQNLGFGKGHNFVLNRLNSQYHAIVNPDIILQEDAFSEIISFMQQDETIGMTIPRLTDEHGNLQAVYRREVTIGDMFIRMFLKNCFKNRQAYHTMQDCDYSKPFQVPFGQGSFLVIRTDLLKKLKGFDDRYFMYMEDADLCKQVNQLSKLMYCPYATVIHKWEKGSHKNMKLFKIHLKSMFLYFKKWGIK